MKRFCLMLMVMVISLSMVVGFAETEIETAVPEVTEEAVVTEVPVEETDVPSPEHKGIELTAYFNIPVDCKIKPVLYTDGAELTEEQLVIFEAVKNKKVEEIIPDVDTKNLEISDVFALVSTEETWEEHTEGAHGSSIKFINTGKINIVYLVRFNTTEDGTISATILETVTAPEEATDETIEGILAADENGELLPIDKWMRINEELILNSNEEFAVYAVIVDTSVEPDPVSPNVKPVIIAVACGIVLIVIIFVIILLVKKKKAK